ncbi:MAG: ABC transporter permease subunit [Dehalogenimonas sp.]
MDLPSIFRLIRLEFKKLFKGKALYIVVVLLIFFAGISTTGWKEDYQNNVRMLHEQISHSESNLEQMAKLPPNIKPPGVIMPGGTNSPPQIDWINRPLKDAAGNLIPENMEYYKQLYTAYYENQIVALTQQGGPFSLGTLMGRGASQVGMLIPILAVALAVGLFATDFRGGYRLTVSRGVRRSSVMTAKLLTGLALAVGLAALFTAAQLLIGLISASGIEGAGLAGVSSSMILSIFAIALLLFVAYIALGGIISMIVGSPSAAMAVGLVIAFISVSFFFNLTPEDHFFLAGLSPVSLGYNFNSLMYYVWRDGDASTRYRDVAPSIAFALTYAAIFITAIYGIFSNKQLRA